MKEGILDEELVTDKNRCLLKKIGDGRKKIINWEEKSKNNDEKKIKLSYMKRENCKTKDKAEGWIEFEKERLEKHYCSLEHCLKRKDKSRVKIKTNPEEEDIFERGKQL
jgi:hypothetical protein